jgi:hypothetical protein
VARPYIADAMGVADPHYCTGRLRKLGWIGGGRSEFVTLMPAPDRRVKVRANPDTDLTARANPSRDTLQDTQCLRGDDLSHCEIWSTGVR